ncbi:MAG: hypothetical protein HC819_09400 [Cyclobacteriaceae bacterium]|nr:hypothetical protein [Cyclobacteriaceae bacterium]
MHLLNRTSHLIFSGMVLTMCSLVLHPTDDIGFCSALLRLDKKSAEKASKPFLDQIDATKERNQNFELIKNWILSHDCIHSVSVSNRLIETEPPRQEFIICMKDESQLSFWITAGQAYTFYDLKNNNITAN